MNNRVIAVDACPYQVPQEKEVGGVRKFLPKFEYKNSFSLELRDKVESYLQSQSRHRLAPLGTCFKAAFLVLIVMIQVLNLIFVKQSVFSAGAFSVLLGVCISIMGFNVMHEAAHGNFSKRAWVNRWIALSMDLCGVSAALYKIKHTIFHHTYTNIDGIDGDISEAPVIRMSSVQPLRKIHRYQWVYALPLYSLLTLGWVFFDDYDRMVRGKIGNTSFNSPKGLHLLRLILLKLLHPLLFLGVPMLFHPGKAVFGCYLLVQMTLGLIVAVVFQVAHLFEGAAFPEAAAKMEDSWMVHQLKTTTDFAVANRIVCFLLGGLNFQVEHHLFPNISYAHYPAIQKLVKETCEKHRVTYHEFPNVSSAIFSHFKLLMNLGASVEGKSYLPTPIRWLRNIWRVIHLLHGLLFLIFKKGDYRVIYTVFRYFMNHPSYQLSLALMKKDKDFDELVRTRYNPRSEVDLKKLMQLPEGTVGRIFAEFMARPEITQIENLPAAHETINPEIDYIRGRIRLTHDIHHVITGFPSTEMGEMGISSFYVAQVSSPLNSMLLAVGLIKCTIKAPHRLTELMETIIEGWYMGKRAKGIFGIKWEETFELPIQQVQAAVLQGPPSRLKWTLSEEPL